jgi:hypothetical protein
LWRRWCSIKVRVEQFLHLGLHLQSIIEEKNEEPALLELAKMVRGADTPNRSLTPYSEALAALANGFSILLKEDYDIMTQQFYVYDALCIL